ncbi:MAG: S49 family peptidase, partial [Deltaproteobacteria bacterium]|nr:S49 family peptidase [Deltaproteobacteria bacterium]
AITGALPERPGEGLFRAPSPSLLDLRLRLAELARDRYVSGVLLKITGAPGSFSQAQELAASIDHMRARGKRVHVYLEEAGNRSVFVAAHGDRVILNPATLLNMLGIHLVWRFYRDTLAAVGVEAQVVRFEEYKAAADPWIQSGSREVVRDAARDMMDATFDQLVGDIAALRGRPREEVEAWVDNSPMAPERARAAGVVDDIAGREGLEAIIRDHEGRPPRLVRSYPSPRAQDLRWGPPPRVAVVVLEGLMITGPSRSVPFLGLRFSGADTVASALDAAAADPSVGAILLRIQSPGGMALAAELVNRKVAEAAKKKPLAASIASAAASGGYYAAAAAPRIFVMPGSVTGSIGVVYGKPVISGLLDLLKVKREHMLRGRHADIECLDRRLSDLEMEHVRGELESLYRLFRERVAEGRKLAPERVHELARGRVWLGAEALRNGLADQEGGVLEALDWLLERMGARPGQRPELIYLPRGTLMGAVLREAGLAAAPGLSLDELAELVFLVARPGLWMLDLSFVDDIFRS